MFFPVNPFTVNSKDNLIFGTGINTLYSEVHNLFQETYLLPLTKYSAQNLNGRDD
jgi:hypothetical protein